MKKYIKAPLWIKKYEEELYELLVWVCLALLLWVIICPIVLSIVWFAEKVRKTQLQTQINKCQELSPQNTTKRINF
jgi:uncharacterized membrane protein